MNILHNNPLSRRTILHGLGAAIALPWLEAMAPRSLLSASDSGRPPVRLAFIYTPNGVQMNKWTPTSEGRDYELPELLAPLAKVRSDVLVLSGLAALEGGHDGGNHAPAMGCFLTGVQPSRDARVGISADQLAAGKIGHMTRLPSLEMGCQRTGKFFCDGFPCVVSGTMSWASPTQPLPVEASPKAVFDRLFAPANPGDKLRNDVRRSILDTVRDEAASLSRKVSHGDRHKIDEYLSSVRDVEQRIVRAETMPAAKLPNGVVRPVDRIPDNFEKYVRLLGDLMVLAFQTDVTRISTLIFDCEGSVRSYPELGIEAEHHHLSHHNGNAEMVQQILKIEHHHVVQLAYILDRLKKIPEGNGTLLDNCLIAYGCALGDGNRHDHYDLPILLAGNGGGSIQSGRHIKYPSRTPVTNLWLAMLDRAGAAVARLGDSTGLLEGLS
jgi:hypothetical protein